MKGVDVLMEPIRGDILKKIICAGRDGIKKVFETIPAGISIATDASCKEIIRNARAAEFMRVKPGEDLSITAEENQPARLFHNGRELVPAELPLQRSAREGEEVKDVEIEFIWDDGVRKIMLANASPLLDEKGAITGAISSFEDITDRREAEEMLNNAKRQLSGLAWERERKLSEAKQRAGGNMLEGIADAFCDLDKGYRFTYVSRNIGEILNCKREDLPGRDIREVFPKSAGATVHSHFRDVMLNNKPSRFTTKSAYTGNWMEVDVYPTSKGISVYFRDVTRRKQIEGELRQACQGTIDILESISDAFYALDSQMRFTYVNRSAAELLGFSPDELIGCGIAEKYPAAGQEKLQIYHQVMTDKKPRACEYFSPVSQKWRSIRAYPNKNGVSVYSLDITERKQAEEALRERENRYRTVFETAGEGIVYAKPGGPCLYCNQRFADMLGYRLDEITGKSLTDFSFPDEQPQIRQIRGALKKGDVPCGEFRFRRKDGTEIWTMHNSTPIFSDNGKYIASFAMYTDITERKRMEKALRESEERYRTLFHSIGEGFAVAEMEFDPAGKPVDYLILEINQAYERQAGLGPEHVLGKRATEFLEGVESVWLERYGKVVSSGEPQRFKEYNAFLGRWFSVHAFPLPAQNRFGMIFTDITECRRAEEVLRASEERQAFLLRLGDALRPLTGVQAIKDTATSLLAEHLRAARASYEEYTREVTGIQNESPGGAGQALALAGTHTKSDFPALAALLRTGKDLVVPDVLSFPACSAGERARLLGMGIRSGIAAPLVKEGKLVAVLIVGQMEPRQWTAAEAELVRETTRRAWSAVERARAGEELKKTLEHLEDKVAERTKELAQERQRLLDVLETLPVNICLLTPDYRVSFANRAFRKMIGEANGRCCYDFVYGFNEPCEFCQSYRVLETGKPHQWRVEIPGGGIIDVYDLPFKDTDGSPLILEMSIDITEQEKVVRALRQSEERFAKMFYNSPILMSVVRMKDNRYLDVNQKFLDLMEYAREEVLGRTAEDLNLVNGEYTTALLDELRERGEVRNNEYRFKTRSGKIVTVWSTTVTMDLNGELCRIALMQDITKEKKLEAEITRLDRLNLVGEMAAGIGHEVRNPMTTVRGFLQLLGKKERYAQDRAYFELMIEELDRANSIITEFLSLAKDKAVNLEKKDLNKILRSIMPLIRADGLITDKYIELKAGKIPKLSLDEKEMRQVVINLVRNGLQAMQPGQILKMETFIEEDQVVLAVKDQGTGIPDNIIDKIGTPFFTTKDSGTGLGLSVCYSVAARHGAVIDFETGPGGATFYVKFKRPE
jgi:PAS domain S-box-containing protein